MKQPGDMQLTSATQQTNVVERMAAEFLASTALSRVQQDIGSIQSDFRGFKENIAKLNAELGEFRDKGIDPIRRELEYQRYTMGARSEGVIANLEKLVHHLAEQIQLVLKARGIDPHKSDTQGDTALDRLGIAPTAPSDRELEAVRHKDSIIQEQLDSQADTIAQLRAQVQSMREQFASRLIGEKS
jgi:peptidoglycan hydrolase CwlO-like protein